MLFCSFLKHMYLNVDFFFFATWEVLVHSVKVHFTKVF